MRAIVVSFASKKQKENFLIRLILETSVPNVLIAIHIPHLLAVQEVLSPYGMAAYSQAL